MRDKHKVLFTLLTHFDENYNQQYSEFGVLSADEIIEDFKNKYLDKDKK